MKKLILILLFISSILHAQGLKKAVVYQPPNYVSAYKEWILAFPISEYSSTFTKMLGFESGSFAFIDRVTLTGAGSATVTGTYPNFTISTTSGDISTDGIPTSHLVTGTTSKTLTTARLNETDITVTWNDLNNYADSVYFTGTTTKTLNVRRSGLANISGSFIDLNTELPAGTEYQTLYHNGTAWAANSTLKVNASLKGVTIGEDNSTLAVLSSIMGGNYNTISDANYSNISGGYNNTISYGTGASANAIGGGSFNNIVQGYSNAVCGGKYNTIDGSFSSIAGGSYLKIGGGSFGFRGQIDTPSSQLDLSADTNTVHFANCNFKQYDGYTQFANLSGTGNAYLSIDADGVLSRGSGTVTTDGIPIAVDYSLFSPEDNQQLLTISRQNMSSLTTILDDMDSQTITLIEDQLSISNGNSVDLSTYINPEYTFVSPLNNNSNTVSIATAGITSSGYLTATDWGIFYNKQDALEVIEPLALNSNTLSMDMATIANSGYLGVSAYNTFYNKQDALEVEEPLSLNSNTLTISLGANFYSQSDLSLDGNNGDYFICDVSASATFSVSNIETGIDYFALVENSGASAITITLPQTADISELTSLEIPPDGFVEFAFIFTGTKRIWAISNNLELNE